MRKEKNRKKRRFMRLSRKQRFIGGIALAGVVAALIIIALASVKVKLLFDTEARVSTAPSIASLSITNDQQATVTFNTTVEKIKVCELSCTYALTDLGSGQEMWSEKSNIQEHRSTLTLSTPGYGEGQTAFNYEARCKASGKLCPTAGKMYTSTSYVSVNYELSPAQEALKQALNNTLQAYNARVAQLATTLAQATEEARTIGQLTQQTDTYRQAAVYKLLLESEERFQTGALEQWQEQRYEELQEALEDYEGLSQAASRIGALAKEVEEAVKAYNGAAILLQGVHAKRENLTAAAHTLQFTNTASYDELLNAEDAYRALLNDTPVPADLLEAAREVDNVTSRALRLAAANAASIAAQEATLTAQAREASIVLANATIDTNNTCLALTEAHALIEAHNTNASNETVTPATLANATKARIDDEELQLYVQLFCNTTAHEELFAAAPPGEILRSESVVPAAELPPVQARCCFQGTCGECGKAQHVPVVLVHGHSFSKSTSPELAFTRLTFLQEHLSRDGYVNVGTLGKDAALESVPAGDWGLLGAPVVASITYYYLNTYGLGELKVTTRKTDSIENYAIRLKENIDVVKEKTGSDEVIIVAHSMGGLVAREYLKLFGDADVKALITLGTPNHGVEADIKKYCTLTGAAQECRDMEPDSTFLAKLNKAANTPVHTQVYTVAAVGCPTKSDEGGVEEGDGVVLARSVALPYATNHVVNGTCTDSLQKSLHMDFVNPNLYPETYEMVREILSGFS